MEPHWRDAPICRQLGGRRHSCAPVFVPEQCRRFREGPGSSGMLAQLFLHRVECFDVGNLKLHRFFTGEAHCQQREAVAGNLIGGAFLSLCIRVFNQRKITLVKIIRRFD